MKSTIHEHKKNNYFTMSKKSILKQLVFIITLFNATTFFAQDFSFKNYNWEEKDTKAVLPEEYKNENEVILKRIIKLEIASVGDVVKQYYLFHDKIYINSDDAIERNNKIYIPFSQNEILLSNKARVILKSGKIITLDKKDIKEELDEERGVKFNYFAVNGLEKGAIVERMYILEENPEIDGKTFKLQTEYPILDLNFELIYPSHVVFYPIRH